MSSRNKLFLNLNYFSNIVWYGHLKTNCVENLQNVLKFYKLVCMSVWIMDAYNQKITEGFFYVEHFQLAAKPLFAYAIFHLSF